MESKRGMLLPLRSPSSITNEQSHESASPPKTPLSRGPSGFPSLGSSEMLDFGKQANGHLRDYKIFMDRVSREIL